MAARVGLASLRVYVAARLGDLITPAAVAATLGWSEAQADAQLRNLAQDRAFGELAEREGGWVYWPPDRSTP